jgi:hypothetical protein
MFVQIPGDARAAQIRQLFGGCDRAREDHDRKRTRAGAPQLVHEGHGIPFAGQRQVDERQADRRAVIGKGGAQGRLGAGEQIVLLRIGQRRGKSIAHGERPVRNEDRLDRHEGISRYNRFKTVRRRVYGDLPRM